MADREPLAIRVRWDVPAAAAGAAIALGTLAMAGWALDRPLLKSMRAGAIAMQPVTALALILSGAALLAVRWTGLPRAIAAGLAACVLLLALLNLGEAVSGAELGLDALLFPLAVSHQPVALPHPGRMAEPAAFCFLLVALALLIARTPGRAASRTFSALATLILVPVGLTLLFYLLGTAPLPALFGFTRIAMPTAAALGALAVGLLALRPDAGWMPLLRGDTVGAGVARRLLPIILVVPVAVAWLAKAGAEAGLYSLGLELAMMTGLSIGALAAVTIWAATRFDRLGAILETEHALREAEQRLIQSQAELIHVSRVSELGAMGSTLAHELSQPLVAIMNYIAVAQRLANSSTGLGSAELKRALLDAHASTERAARIIRGLRAFVTRGEVHKAPHEIDAIIEDALALAHAGGVLTDAETELRFDPSARWVLADPIQIQQVLGNLFRNAAEIMEGMERRALVVATRCVGKMVEISVADTGPGVIGDDYEQMFTSFYTSKGVGMGLGLSISRTIVEAHDGRIWAEPGESGAVFRFTLPAARAPRREAAAQAA